VHANGGRGNWIPETGVYHKSGRGKLAGQMMSFTELAKKKRDLERKRKKDLSDARVALRNEKRNALKVREREAARGEREERRPKKCMTEYSTHLILF